MKVASNTTHHSSPTFRFVFVGIATGFAVAAMYCASNGVSDFGSVLATTFIGCLVGSAYGSIASFLWTLFDRKIGPWNVSLLTTAFLGIVASTVGLNIPGLHEALAITFRVLLVTSFGVCGLFCCWAFVALLQRCEFESRKSKTRRQAAYHRHMERKAIYKRFVDRNRKDYETRLSRFVANQSEQSDPVPEPELEPFVSKMPFWQRTPFQVGKVPKPVDLIRVLLQRISKAVYQGKKA